MSRPLILALDPGFAFLGYALLELLPDGSEDVLALGVVRTSPSNKKRKVLSADDNVRRCREISVKLSNLMNGLLPKKGNGIDTLLPIRSVRIVAAEAMSFPRNSSSAAKMAMTWGLIIGEVESANLPLLQASPQEVKVALTGKKDASKSDVEKAVLRRYASSSRKLQRFLADVPEKQREHAWDALAAGVACLNSDQVRLIRNLVA